MSCIFFLVRPSGGRELGHAVDVRRQVICLRRRQRAVLLVLILVELSERLNRLASQILVTAFKAAFQENAQHVVRRAVREDHRNGIVVVKVFVLEKRLYR
jgi:hypothetical protein